MDKHKNADRHKIYPGFRKFYDKGLLKATYKDIALKKEYQCSKCGKKIKIDNYEKMRKRSRLIQWLIRCLVVGSVVMFRGDFHDVFAKIFLSYYKTQDPLFWLWETVLCKTAEKRNRPLSRRKDGVKVLRLYSPRSGRG